MNKFILIIISFVFASCSSKHQENKDYAIIKKDELAKDFKIPSKILDSIDQSILTELKSVRPVYIFSPIEVILESEDKKMIKNGGVKIEFPNGGGQLNLSDYIYGQGTFSIKFNKKIFEKNPELIHLYYISDSPVKSIDGEKYGLGCGKMVDLKPKYDVFISDTGLVLNTTHERHLSVLAGYYVFIFKNKNQVWLTHLHITDKNFTESLCSSAYNE